MVSYSRHNVVMVACFFLCTIIGLYPPLKAQNKVSVTNKPINESEEIFRFAIVGDRTGGMTPGVFARAAEKINLMQPEFVLSVGDLIDGYTTDPEVWNDQWEEFDGIVDRLDMPFYYVPGNHDISNDLLLEAWMKRHGDPYYTFVYKDVLFVSLHTEDREGSGVGVKQIQYIKEQLNKHNDVRWTMIFMHRPIWSYGNQAGYGEIEEALKGRNYTVFSGHHHHYEYQQRNGMGHYVLATTGGGSYLRGVEFGEFNHITWVTMKDDGPKVAHIEFDHIFGKDIVTPKNKAMVQALRMGEWMQIEPVVLEQAEMNSTNIPITLSNPVNASMWVEGQLTDPLLGFYPLNVKVTVPALSDTTVLVRANWSNDISLHELNEHGVKISLKATYEQPNGENLSLPATKRLVFDAPHVLKKSTQKITIDADIKEWDQQYFTPVRNPVYMHEGWDWKGQDDGMFSFATNYDEKNLYVAIQASDQRLIAEEDVEKLQDKFFVRLNPYAPSNRKTEYPDRLFGFEPVPESYHYQIDISHKIKDGNHHIRKNSDKFNIEAATSLNDYIGIHTLELAIPISAIEDIQGPNWKSIRLNVGWMDHDRPENTKPSVLWWRPVWGSSQDDPGMGVFLRKATDHE